jgi:choice-of-anchor C domain-containing protein
MAVGVAVLALLACPPKALAGLITNGGFESGPNPGPFTQLAVGSTAITGWIVTRAPIDYCGTIWPASEGTRSIDLAPSGTNASGGIAQTFATVCGLSYSVQFDMAGNPGFGAGDGVKSLRVTAAGQSNDFLFDTTGHTLSDIGWVARTWTFVAAGPTTTLEFFSLDAPEVFGPTIDNVSVQETTGAVAPAPASVLLLAVGGLSLLGYGRCRRRRAA